VITEGHRIRRNVRGAASFMPEAERVRVPAANDARQKQGCPRRCQRPVVMLVGSTVTVSISAPRAESSIEQSPPKLT